MPEHVRQQHVIFVLGQTLAHLEQGRTNGRRIHEEDHGRPRSNAFGLEGKSTGLAVRSGYRDLGYRHQLFSFGDASIQPPLATRAPLTKNSLNLSHPKAHGRTSQYTRDRRRDGSN